MTQDLNARLGAIAAQDVRALVKAEADYGTSWKDRGGVGAFFVWVRKYDRMVLQLKKFGYDVFAAVKADQRPEGLIDDIRDARRYLMLWEDELQQLGYLPGNVAKEQDHMAGLPIKVEASGFRALVQEVKAAPDTGPGYLRDEVRGFAVLLEEWLRLQGERLPAKDGLYYASHVNVEAGALFVMEQTRARDRSVETVSLTEPRQQVMRVAQNLLNYMARLGLLPQRTVVERALDYHLEQAGELLTKDGSRP